MKMKEIWQGESLAPALDPPMHYIGFSYCQLKNGKLIVQLRFPSQLLSAGMGLELESAFVNVNKP